MTPSLNILLARSWHFDSVEQPKAGNDEQLFREALSGALQGIGWVIGMAICGLAFVAFHLLIWPALIVTLPVTVFLFWRNPHFVSQRWEQIRRRIWQAVREKYGYTTRA